MYVTPPCLVWTNYTVSVHYYYLAPSVYTQRIIGLLGHRKYRVTERGCIQIFFVSFN